MESRNLPTKKIVIFASGSGTNAENIIRYFQNNKKAAVVAVFSNKKDAGALERARKLGVETFSFTRSELYEEEVVLEHLRSLSPDLVVLAGFLWMFPPVILKEFHNKVVNIHPALLPKFGGKGMYGMRVHQAVVDQKEKESGISIHLVNEAYDEGRLLFQKSIPLSPEDTPEELAKKIHALEYEHFPRAIEQLLYPENDA